MAHAVKVRDACKSYKDVHGKNVVAISNVNLNVECGSIYGLLGPSGCGKTTLLSCIVGLKELDTGNISVFSLSPRHKDLGIPGPSVGYMPQETALNPIFRVSENLYYYGRICGMNASDIEQRTSDLMSLLHLPEKNKLVSNLSGGQLRRLSLASALIHEPPLLILDEPTVGLDPLVREGIWHHLQDLVKRKETTVIITTHYVEEARTSDKVGILRAGKLLVEDTPESLMADCGTLNLEDAVLHLCHNNEKDCSPRKESLTPSPETVECELITFEHHGSSSEIGSESHMKFKKTPPNHWYILAALLFKKLFTEIRIWPLFVTQMLLPIIQTFIIQSVVGVAPTGVNIAYVSEDWNNMKELGNLYDYCIQNSKLQTCFEDEMASICMFLKQFKSSDIHWSPASTRAEGLSLVKEGKAFGFLVFPNNFTHFTAERLALRKFADNDTISGSEMKLRLDMADAVKNTLILGTFVDKMSSFLKQCVSSLGVETTRTDIPLKFHPVYGDLDPDQNGWRIATQPTVIIVFMFVLANVGGMHYAVENRHGLVERDKVAGVKFWHFLLANFLFDSLIMLGQIILFFFILTTFYQMKIEGSPLLAFILTYIASLSGWALGLTVASYATHEMEGLVPLLFINIFNILNSGIIWPLAAVPYWYRMFCYAIPATLPSRALSDIMFRAKGLEHPTVLIGFGSCFLWFIICGLLMFNKHRKSW